ncbi:MAG: MFS transporter, partial [Actinomycetota bacterium]|nr:MFS transporter [Actinomycetota bacterium]
ALLGSIGTAVYRARVGDAIPAGIPDEVARATLDTLGAATAATEPLGDAGAALLEAARQAFTSGLRVTAAVSAVIAVAVALPAAHLLRRVRPLSEAGQEQAGDTPAGLTESR